MAVVGTASLVAVFGGVLLWLSIPWKDVGDVLKQRPLRPVSGEVPASSPSRPGFRPLLDSPAEPNPSGPAPLRYGGFLGQQPTPDPVAAPAPEFFVTAATARYSDCCVEINGVVKNFGDAAGTCDVRVLGYVKDQLTYQRVTVTSPYRIAAGDTGGFSITFFHTWADWRVEVRSPKLDSFGKSWLKTMTKTVD
jgi:hypothetical protein